MPFYANTPESRLGRSDSKNPSSTCRGVTSSGRPCRRPIAAENAAPAPANSRLKPSAIRTDDPADENLYCYQHKDQASASTKSSPGPRMSHTPILEERTSIDTLAERLGLLRTQSEKPPNVSGRPNGTQRPTKMARPKPTKQATCCFGCFTVPVDEIEPPPRPRPQPVQPTSVSTPARPGGKKTSSQHLAPPSPSRPRPGSSAQSPGRHSRRTSSASQAGQVLSLIPQDTDPQTASQLLAELAKPISQQDEPGYIYIFWLTSESEPSTPPAEAARSLLAPPSTPNRGRRPSDVLSSFARSVFEDDDDDDTTTRTPTATHKNKKEHKKILLKIGRATNVQRRLNEWQRQCGYNLSLIRYYPYIPSSSPGGVVERKVPHSHKVERLVHIELTGRGLRVTDREKCEACGREHREWFEVEASRSAVADVDEVVRRWSDWDEGI